MNAVSLSAIPPCASIALLLAASVCAPRATGAPPPATTYQAADAATNDEVAADLDAKAKHYAKIASRYRIRSSGGSKQQATLDNLAWRYERLAEEHRMAAVRVRKLAESKRPADGAK